MVCQVGQPPQIFGLKIHAAFFVLGFRISNHFKNLLDFYSLGLLSSHFCFSQTLTFNHKINMYISTVIRRTLIRQRSPVACLKRFDHGGPTAGAVASSRDFGEKEKAVENQWARMHVSNNIDCVRIFVNES